MVSRGGGFALNKRDAAPEGFGVSGEGVEVLAPSFPIFSSGGVGGVLVEGLGVFPVLTGLRRGVAAESTVFLIN